MISTYGFYKWRENLQAFLKNMTKESIKPVVCPLWKNLVPDYKLNALLSSRRKSYQKVSAQPNGVLNDIDNFPYVMSSFFP